MLVHLTTWSSFVVYTVKEQEFIYESKSVRSPIQPVID